MTKKTISFVLVCALYLSVLGCSQGESSGNESGSWNQGQVPDDARLEEIFHEFEQYAEKGMDDWQVPGMVIAVVKDNETIYQKTFGVKKVNDTDPVTNNTLFQVGSTTKAFTVALVGMQVDEGKLNWDDKVIDRLPGFRMYDPWVTREFTVTDLMAQRSGLPAHSGDLLPALGYGRDYLRSSLHNMEPVTSFRSTYAYQNIPFLWSAALVENETGKSWEENIEERIFQPLGMSNSSTDMESYRQAGDVAFLHQKRNGSVVALPMDWTYMDWVYTFGPAGGINSNIVDMTKWLRLQMHNGRFEGRQIISENSTRYMHSPKTIISPVSVENSPYYCQGWVYQEFKPYPVIWHNGGTLGHKSMVAFVPKAKIGIVVLSNIISELPDSLAFRFFDLYFGNPSKDYSGEALNATRKAEAKINASIPKRPENPNAPLPLMSYAGNYSNPIYGQINIASGNDSLVITAGPKKAKMLMQPWDRDTFSFTLQDFSDDMGFGIFQIGPNGKGETLELSGGTFEDRIVFKRMT